jgi:hypothetical protein
MSTNSTLRLRLLLQAGVLLITSAAPLALAPTAAEAVVPRRSRAVPRHRPDPDYFDVLKRTPADEPANTNSNASIDPKEQFSASLRFTIVYIQRAGRWQMAAWHSARVP